MSNQVYEEDICTEELADKIRIGYGTFGTHRAICVGCSFTSAYWECACELNHDCNEEAN